MEVKSNNMCMNSVFTQIKYNLNKEKDWILIYGNPKRQSFLKNLLYSHISRMDEFFCIYLESSEIKTPLDFYLPILKKKFGDEYFEENIVGVVDMFIDSDEKEDIFSLSEMCGKEKVSGIDNSDKMPVILIDGIEEVLFGLDHPGINVDKSCIVLNNQKLSDDLGFGKSVRKYLHQIADKAIVYGTVKDPDSIEYLLTLGNEKYQLYANNFLHIHLSS
ncbi:MAG: hypothetical protein KAS90_05090 [Candidatus Aenigmarchaeota archaeon]|nr:hypothetical protein [Candidatus Aenigmarchaeota archaeon]